MTTNTQQIIDRSEAVLVGNYARFPVAFVRGEGNYLFDADGKRYLDLLAGLGVCALGHAHAKLAAAIKEQSENLLHTSNLYYTEPAVRLAEQLVAATFAERVFFCNSGTEANEAAIKLARRYRPGRHEIVAAFGSFHGRTLGALAATGQPALQEGFGPMPEGFVHVAYDDPDAVAEAIGEATAAVMVEPVLGEGGIVIPNPGYLKRLREICDATGALLILDEVQSGNGRTGKFFAHEHEGIVPDIVTTAKGLAGGLPIGAVLTSAEIAAAFVPGTHGTTFGANPVACAAGSAVLEALTGGLIENARDRGDQLLNLLRSRLEGRDGIVEVRGKGLMVAVEFSGPTRPLVDRLLEAGFITNATAGNVLRLLPPLTIQSVEIEEFVQALVDLL